MTEVDLFESRAAPDDGELRLRITLSAGHDPPEGPGRSLHHDPPRRDAHRFRITTVRREVKMTQARAAGGHAMRAARDLRGATRHAAYAAGQAGVVAHVAAHELGAAACLSVFDC